MKGGEPETEDVGAGSHKMSFYTLDRLLAINSIDPRRTIKHSAFKCNIVIVDSLDNLVGEYLLKCGDSLGILITRNLKYRKDNQIAYCKVINVNPDGVVGMFRILISIEERHINIFEVVILQDFFNAIRPIFVFL